MNEEKLLEIKQEAINNKIPIIMDETLAKIKQIVKFKVDKILEIGTAVGYSAICFTEFLSENGKIDTIEKDEERVKEAKKNIVKADVKEKINVIHGDAVQVLTNLNGEYDIIFIDASKGKYPIFLNEALRLSKKGSFILADNVLYKGYVFGEYNKHKQRTAVRNLREFIENIIKNKILDTKIYEVGDGLSVSVKKV